MWFDQKTNLVPRVLSLLSSRQERDRGRDGEREGGRDREREGETWERCCTKGAHKPQAIASLIFLPHVEVFCVLLLRGRMETWNLFVSYNEQKEKTDKLVS